MSSYLGNQKLIVMEQGSMPIANFEYPQDPTVDVNPVRVPVSWLNTVTGVIWVCIDNTTDANVWKCHGQIVTEKEAFTPAVANSANITWTGQKWRTGNILNMEIYGLCSGNFTGNAILTLPDSLSYDSSVIPATSMFGEGVVNDVGVADYPVHLYTIDATTMYFVVDNASATRTVINVVNASIPMVFASGDTIKLFVQLPILGWKINTIS